ncbi:acyl-CoA dehydrogenase family protein [Agromyces sp. SYSU T00266]|uniref:acyl-CoA dehydrogenase family protein n=1 Tax=Agromyces zhanjiangensis TaxID=3158562 RepID=UPI0033993C71
MTTVETSLAPGSASAAEDLDGARSRANVDLMIGRLNGIATELEAEIEGNERAGVLSPRTLELLRQIQLPSMLIPESLGGMGMFPRDALAVGEKLAAIDSSVGWVGMNWSSTGLLLAFLTEETAKDLLESGPAQPCFGASGTPTGKALPADGGYRVSGKWAYGSGDLHADYVIVSAVLADDEGQPVMMGTTPVMLSFVVEAKDITPLGNWDVLGLRATGSVDFVVQDVFVPEDRVFSSFGAPQQEGRQVSGGIWIILTMLHTAFALGASRRLLDEVSAYALRPSSFGKVLADNPQFRDQYARHEIAARSARAWVYEVWDEVDSLMKSGAAIERRHITLLRAAMINLHLVVRELATFVFAKAGGTSLRAGTLQRWVRDSLAGCQHIIVSDGIYPDVAHELLGAPENLVWTPLGLQAV